MRVEREDICFKTVCQYCCKPADERKAWFGCFDCATFICPECSGNTLPDHVDHFYERGSLRTMLTDYTFGFT